jgi:hypothetical protein
MVDLNGHEAGNGGHSQVKPTALRMLLYSERGDVTSTTLLWRQGTKMLGTNSNDTKRTDVKLEYMRKSHIRLGGMARTDHPLDLSTTASVEVTSEEKDYPMFSNVSFCASDWPDHLPLPRLRSGIIKTSANHEPLGLVSI